MKNRVFVFVMLATALAGLVSCNCKPARYAVTLEPLAQTLLAQTLRTGSLEALAAPFIDSEKEVPDAAAALQGASDIIDALDLLLHIHILMSH